MSNSEPILDDDFNLLPDDIEEVSPWTDIWVRPRKTIDWIIQNYSNWLVTAILIYLAGVNFGIGQAELKNYGDIKTAGKILVNSLLVSGLAGLITYNIWIWSIDFAASWFGGRGDFKRTQIAFAWSMVPTVVALILSLISYLLFDEEMFTSSKTAIENNTFLFVSFWILAILEGVLAIWQIVLLVVTVSQVQKISIMKSIASIVIGFMLMITPLIGLVFLIL